MLVHCELYLCSINRLDILEEVHLIWYHSQQNTVRMAWIWIQTVCVCVKCSPNWASWQTICAYPFQTEACILWFLPVMMYWESRLNSQSHTQRCCSVFSTVISSKSAVLQIRTVLSADVVASNLSIRCKLILQETILFIKYL